MLSSSPRLSLLTRGWRAAAAALALAVLAGCASIGPPQDKVASQSLPVSATASTRLAQALAPALAAQPRRAGVVVLGDGSEAFAARLQLAAVAERSIDLQTYIFRADSSGLVMIEQLRAAADRGVRVRLLIDDNGTKGLDPVLALLDRHPQVEVRLYNPFANRDFRLAELVRDLRRLNSRMHAKSMVVDGQVAIMGGRNIGDEYADLATEVNFTDMDVLVVGSPLPRAAASFDRFWNAAQAYPLPGVVPPAVAWSEAEFAQRLAQAHERLQGAGFESRLAAAKPVDDLLAGRRTFQWAPAALWVDDPGAAEAVDADSPLDVPGRLVPRLRAALNAARTQLDLVSPYFVPDEASSQALQALAQRGVRVRVLTNSLAATDVVAVHTGYAKRRLELLRAGVQIHELRPAPGSAGASRTFSINGSSNASLHAKAFAVDRRRLFVGSFNLDPRSARLNDELVLAIDSPVLATQLADTLDRTLPSIAYTVTATPDGALRWQFGSEQLTGEPQAGAGRRALAWLLSLFDIDWLL